MRGLKWRALSKSHSFRMQAQQASQAFMQIYKKDRQHLSRLTKKNY
jgi:hypothetical protein